MMQAVRNALHRVDFSAYLSDPRDDYQQWRRSERPIYHLIHGILETLLVVGLGIRFFCHVTSYVIHYEDKHKERCKIDLDMLHFNNIVTPVLEPEDARQEVTMRVHTFVWGVFILFMATGTYTTETLASTDDIGLRYGFITPQIIFWGRLFIATHLCLDPVLGVADRIASADLQGRLRSGWNAK